VGSNRTLPQRGGSPPVASKTADRYFRTEVADSPQADRCPEPGARFVDSQRPHSRGNRARGGTPARRRAGADDGGRAEQDRGGSARRGAGAGSAGDAAQRAVHQRYSGQTATTKSSSSANGKLSETQVRFKDDAHLLHIIEKIVSQVGRRIDEAQPIVDARLQDGSRVNAIIPPLALDGPCLSIRRFRPAT